ncbi:MAG: hypothetical protein ABJB74_18350 [Gemmatimonas sp.]
MRPATALVAALSIIASAVPVALQAQTSPHVPTGVLSGRIAFAVSDPKGDFGKNTGTGYGLDLSGLVRLEQQGILNLRFDGAFLSYASSTRRVPFVGTGNLVNLDLKTSSNIFTLVGGPQIFGPKGVFTPYVSALGGFSYFGTTTSVEGSNNTNEDFASTTNSSDFSVAYGASAGAYVRVYKTPTRDVRMELGARYLRHDNAKYLNDQRVEEGYQANRDPIPLRGRADFVTYYIGINAVLW